MIRRYVWALPVAILSMAVAVPIQGADPPPEALGLIRAMCLNLQAKRAIESDRDLAPLDLAVKVHNGVAEVSGLVPTEEVGRRVVARVAAVPGVQEVRPNLFFRDTRCQADIPSCVKSAKTDSSIDTAPRRRPGEPGLVKNAEGRKPVAEHPAVRARNEALPDRSSGVKILAPRQVNRSETLASRIEKVRESKAAYRSISVTVKGNDVIVHRRNGQPEAVNAFYHALEGIPGVGDVLLASD